MKRFALCIVLLAACGCANMATSTSRFGKDLCVVAASPAQIPCGAVEDALTYSDDSSVSVSFSPVTVPLMAVKHAYFTMLYALDMVWYPIYLPLGLEPMNLYEMRRFPWRTHPEGHKWLYDELFEGVDDR